MDDITKQQAERWVLRALDLWAGCAPDERDARGEELNLAVATLRRLRSGPYRVQRSVAATDCADDEFAGA